MNHADSFYIVIANEIDLATLKATCRSVSCETYTFYAGSKAVDDQFK